MEVHGQLDAPTALPSGNNPSTHLIRVRVGSKHGLQNFGKKKKSTATAGIRTPARSARSYPLHKLRCAGSFKTLIPRKKIKQNCLIFLKTPFNFSKNEVSP
jgi:hypothetical protein